MKYKFDWDCFVGKAILFCPVNELPITLTEFEALCVIFLRNEIKHIRSTGLPAFSGGCSSSANFGSLYSISFKLWSLQYAVIRLRLPQPDGPVRINNRGVDYFLLKIC